MKIVLINPTQSTEYPQPPIGLASIAGVLEETDFTVKDIVNLKAGDVLRLDSKITNNLKVFVEGQNKFYGKLGLFGSKKAIQIVGSSRDDFD